MLYKVLFLLYLVPITGCSYKQEQKMRVEYYESWRGYSHPVKLINKIDSSEIKNFKAYYMAKFAEDKLLSVAKYLNDTVVYTFEYEYDPEGNYIGKK